MNTQRFQDRIDIYGGVPPTELPMYSYAAAARYLHVPASTVSWWVKGRHAEGYEPVLNVPHERGLTFHDLLELHALNALRKVHGVKLGTIRQAVAFAEHRLRIDRLLSRSDLMTFGGDLFIDHLGEIVGLSKGGQVALRRILARYLTRIERDADAEPIRFYPEFLGVDLVPDAKPVSIAPTVAFGKPTLKGTGIHTAVVAARIDAGETTAQIADDYGLDEPLIESAVTYEKAA